MTKAFQFEDVSLPYFVLLLTVVSFACVCVIAKKPLPSPRSGRLISMPSPKNCIV